MLILSTRIHNYNLQLTYTLSDLSKFNHLYLEKVLKLLQNYLSTYTIFEKYHLDQF